MASTIKTLRTLKQARRRAQEVANKTGNSVIVYKSTVRDDELDFGAALTLPVFAEPTGERYYPQEGIDGL